MRNRPYYSVRTGKHIPKGIDLPLLKRLFLALYDQLAEDGYFQEYFGYYCVDADFVEGKLGSNINTVMLLSLKKDGLWPIESTIEEYSEDDLFDVIEFLFDHISSPIDGYNHTYNNCGWHYTEFDQKTGQQKYRTEVNNLIQDYKNGYELTSKGEILTIVTPGFEKLIQAKLPSNDPKNISVKIEKAILKFRRYRSSLEERRDALRELVDVLEFLRPKLKNVLTRKDESDLFNIVNNFGIRHHNLKQKTDYDKTIWYSWLFYYYLATIHAAQRLIEKSEKLKQKD